MNYRKKIVNFMIPTIILLILNQAYAVVDNIIVAQYVNERALAILAACMSILNIGYSIVNGISSTAVVIIGRIYGQRNYEELPKAFASIMKVGLFISLLISVITFLFRKELLLLIHTPYEILDETTQLLSIYILSFVMSVIGQTLASSINGMGNSKHPTIIIVFTQILNIILDIITVKHLQMGVIGAAYASLFSQLVSIIGLQILFISLLKQHQIEFKKDAWNSSAYIVSGIRIAIPSILQQSIMSLGATLLSTLVNSYGVAYMSGYSAANSITNLFLIPIIGVANTLEVFASQAIGATDTDALHTTEHFLIRTGFIICLTISIATILFYKPLLAMFLSSDSIIGKQFASTYILLLIPNYWLLLLKNSMDAIMKAHLKISLFVFTSFIALFLRIVISYTLVSTLGLVSIAYATILGNFCGMILSIYLRKNHLPTLTLQND